MKYKYYKFLWIQKENAKDTRGMEGVYSTTKASYDEEDMKKMVRKKLDTPLGIFQISDIEEITEVEFNELGQAFREIYEIVSINNQEGLILYASTKAVIGVFDRFNKIIVFKGYYYITSLLPQEFKTFRIRNRDELYLTLRHHNFDTEPNKLIPIDEIQNGTIKD